MNDQNAMRQYRLLLRRRRGLLIAFLPVGLALMLVLQRVLPADALFVAFPVLVVYIVAFTIAIRQLDTCPWCKRSFHSSERTGGAGPGALFRRQCANCGRPDAGGRSERH